MNRQTLAVLATALVAGGLGLALGLAGSDGTGLLRSEFGQRLFALLPARKGGDRAVIAHKGDRVASMALRTPTGGSLQVPGQFHGRPLLVNLWASWCGPCRAEMPELDRFAATQGANGVQVVGIALDDTAAVRDFLATTPVRYPIAVDAPGPRDAGVRLGNARGVLPYTVLLDADGRVLAQRFGAFEPGALDTWTQAHIQTTD